MAAVLIPTGHEWQMKELFLIRHAKSSWADSALRDHDRGLNDRGRRQLDLMRDVIQQAGAFDGPVFCSTAVRARLTLNGLLADAQPSSIEFDPALYTFDCRDLMTWLAQRAEDRLTLVGHNPALEDLGSSLLEPGPDHWPTCAFAQIELATTDWGQIDGARTRLIKFVTPKSVARAR